MSKRFRWVVVCISIFCSSGPLLAQVKTEVPPVVPGARPVTVERIKIHGSALEGNLEGERCRSRRPRLSAAELQQGARTPLSGGVRAARLLHRRRAVVAEIHVPQTIEGAFAKGAQGDDRGAAGLEDGAQRLDVLELGHHGRLRELHRPRRGGLHRRALPDDSATRRAAAWSVTRWAVTARRASA